MTRAAIYARYSSDNQRDASIEDQVRICRDRAEGEGWQLFNCYSDHAVSGASLLRPGIQMLLSDAIAGKFDIIVAEALAANED
jgi:site-specific DNA recombinase